MKLQIFPTPLCQREEKQCLLQHRLTGEGGGEGDKVIFQLATETMALVLDGLLLVLHGINRLLWPDPVIGD
jgi:hypothetical protein